MDELNPNCAHCLGDLEENSFGDLVCRNPECFLFAPKKGEKAPDALTEWVRLHPYD